MNGSSFIWASRILKSRHARRTVKRHILSALLGVVCSMIPLVFVIILANGMIDGITRRIIMVDSGMAKVHQLRDHSDQELQELSRAITRELRYEVQVLYQGDGVIFSEADNQLVTIRGIEPDSSHMQQIELIAGSTDLARSHVVLSEYLAERLKVSPGERITMLTIVEDSSGAVRYKPTLLTVGAVATTGYHMLDKGMVFISSELASSVFTDPSARIMRLLPREDDLRGSLGSVDMDQLNRLLGGSWYAVPWEDQYVSLYRSYRSTKVLLYVIMAMIVIAAGVHISSCSLMIIIEHTEAIGILRSMGVPVFRIRRTFVITGMIIGLAGTVIGIVLGSLLGSQINHILQFLQIRELKAMEFYLASIDIYIPALEIFAVFLYGVCISFISSYVPTRHIHKMSPLKIITS